MEREILRERKNGERTNERTNEFFINGGKGISTIYFFSSSPRAKKKKERERESTLRFAHVSTTNQKS